MQLAPQHAPPAVESSSRGLVALVVRTRFKTRCRARMTDLLGMGGACHVRWTMRVCGYIDVHGEGAKCSANCSGLSQSRGQTARRCGHESRLHAPARSARCRMSIVRHIRHQLVVRETSVRHRCQNPS